MTAACQKEQAIQRMMRRLAELLDEDQFSEMEEMARDAGVSPAPERDVLIAGAVNRFLGWQLPDDFYPDCGISFDRTRTYHPIGTNLFTASQAKQMFEYVLDEQAGVA